MQNRLEQYLEEVSRPLPNAERHEWRAEAEQHLSALIGAYEELGHSREEATELAVAKFGDAGSLGGRMCREAVRTRAERSVLLRGILTVAQTSVMWTVIWGAIAAGVVGLVSVLDPATIDFGERPLDVMKIVGPAGFSAGAIFGLMLLVGERGRRILEAPTLRAGFWGILAGALSTGLGFNQAHPSNTCALGCAAALVTIVICRLMEKRPLDDVPVKAS